MQVIDTSLTSVFHDHKVPSSVAIIGAGTGGPQALAEILPRIPSSFTGTIIVVQQMRPGFTRVLADHFGAVCPIPVYEPISGQVLQASEILIVPSDMSISLKRTASVGCIIELDDAASDPESMHNRINQAMSSAAAIYGRMTIGVLLTGLGDDGRDGMKAIADAGGVTIAQDEASCVVFDMPASAINAGYAHQIQPLWSIADRIVDAAMEETRADAA